MNIYFIRLNGSNLFKIGSAVNPVSRLATLQSGCPYELELFGVIDRCSRGLESILHDRFKDSRVRGEWFELAQENVEGVIREYQNKATTQVRVTMDDLLSAIEKEPTLTPLGLFGAHDRLGEERSSFQRWLIEFEQCCKWLTLCHKVKRLTRSSYNLKHSVEDYYNTYIPNGVLIAAVIHIDFKYEAHPPNAQVTIGIPDSIIVERGESKFAPGGQIPKSTIMEYFGYSSWDSVTIEDFRCYEQNNEMAVISKERGHFAAQQIRSKRDEQNKRAF